ncbi:hypothetical protein ACIA3Z_08610 [Lactobacillus delbrueckii subsp. bulgaricus]
MSSNESCSCAAISRLIPGLEGKKIRNKRERHEKISERGLADLAAFKAEKLDD